MDLSGAPNVEYFKQNNRHDWMNYILSSRIHKAINPLSQNYSYDPDKMTQMPHYYNFVPQASWDYGSIDYHMRKVPKEPHDGGGLNLDDKNKLARYAEGGLNEGRRPGPPKEMGWELRLIPRGCMKELKRYRVCAGGHRGNEKAACFDEKISIMEVCPQHVLEQLREKQKHMLRARIIDNQTYRRAMTVSQENKGRSISSLILKDCSYGDNLRDGHYYSDDRYNPKSYTQPHRFDKNMFPDQEYMDFIGGNKGIYNKQIDAMSKQPILGGNTKMEEYQAQLLRTAQEHKLPS